LQAPREAANSPRLPQDDTAAVLKAWAAQSPIPVNLQFEARKGASYARNCGLRAARGSLFVWTDDDCRLAPDHIATALKYDAADAELVFRGGRVALGDPSDYPISTRMPRDGTCRKGSRGRYRNLGGLAPPVIALRCACARLSYQLERGQGRHRSQVSGAPDFVNLAK
jgi:glycosyltransferase involved in cell wall biosynthesis